jgi:cation diffusion facilitator family transporter
MNKQGAAFISIISNSFLILLKIGAGVMMGSVAVISEAIHSGIDLLASIVAFISIREAVKPADQEHPYGHGKFESISGFFEAILIFVAAGLIIVEAVKKMTHPGVMEKLDWGIAVMLVSVVVNIIVSRVLFRISKQECSIALEADAMHLWVDVFTSVGVIAGLVVIRVTGLTMLDPVIAILVAAMILKASWDLTKRSLEELADKSLPPEEVERITAILKAHPQILGFHKMRTRQNGSQRELDIHLTIDPRSSVHDAHELCNHVETEIAEVLPEMYITTHVEPHRAP